ncbi:precorrin-3B C(17)-methyltransferase [Clostridium sp. BJN0001]|uniref:precorrin-3B C(17)-methyltransferase n=1 Tax=Clostridium sp. BJN0001 TaxID=2930219 RepID=UPI001FD5077D|nr:precorrin-3B C(17)-methyltransferase [Clostridium sp. BJN0001]
MGKLKIVGIGPGSIENMTLRAFNAIKNADAIVGYTKYIDMIKELTDGKEIFSSGMRQETERCKKALLMAKEKNVALISTGDAGIYAMAGLILEMKGEDSPEIEIIPGLTASIGASSLVGAPLMNDSCSISLSDLMVPYEKIKKRVYLAAEADFVISFYNPKSRNRSTYLKECIDIVRKFREDKTPVALVKNGLRDNEEIRLCTISDIDYDFVDMMTMVIVGNSESYYKNNIFITPRGYEKAGKIK